jgi:CheY-like chemotaxis protein
MSHEIRTPMNGVLGLADLLRAGRLDADQAEIVETIHLSGEHLLTVINDILDFSKIDAGKVELESIPVDLRRLVAGCASILAPRAAEKGLALRTEVDEALPGAVLGDPGRLRQIVLNLLSNAIKFTPSGSVTVRAAPRTLADGRPGVEVEVVDTGIGIPPDRQRLLFQSFSQVDASTTRQYGGTGLGLAISARLVQLMGGRIGVASEPGKGSTFRFLVPAAATSGEAASGAEVAGLTAAAIASGASKLAILVAEDNPVNQKVIQRMLAHYGCTADVVGNGALAVEATFRRPYDLVFMDVQMPVLDGLEATRRLRSHPPPRRPHIVALTADAMPGDRERCLEAGADDYAAKPLRLEALAAALARFLASRRAAKP